MRQYQGKIGTAGQNGEAGPASAKWRPVGATLLTAAVLAATAWSAPAAPAAAMHGNARMHGVASGAGTPGAAHQARATNASGASQTRGVSGAIYAAIRGKCLSAYPNYISHYHSYRGRRPAGPRLAGPRLAGPRLASQGLVAGIGDCAASRSQRWTLPGDNTIRVQGTCLTVRHKASGTGVVIASCDGSAGQFWEKVGIPLVPGVELVNPWSGRCLTDPHGSRASGTQVQISGCSFGTAKDTWYPPPTHPR
jgi:hypothetical protein